MKFRIQEAWHSDHTNTIYIIERKFLWFWVTEETLPGYFQTLKEVKWALNKLQENPCWYIKRKRWSDRSMLDNWRLKSYGY